MDSFEVNKLIGALLGTVFVVFSIGLISDALFASPAPEKPGFEIVAAEEPADSGAAEPAAPQADRPTAGHGRRQGRRRDLQEMPGLPYRRKGRRQQGRPESVGHRQPAGRLA